MRLVELKIAILSRSDATGGGASKVADTLRRLLERDIEVVDHWVSAVRHNDSGITKSVFGGAVTRVLTRIIAFISRKLGFPDVYTPEWLWLRLKGFPENYDLVHLHDISRTLSPFSVQYIASRVPVVWTLHDCSAFTAGCLFPIECTQFLGTCHDCDKLNLWPMQTSVNQVAHVHELKRRIYHGIDIYPVAPSKWMAELADSSGMFHRQTVVIPNSVDTSVFLPCSSRNSRREALGIAPDRFVVVVAGHTLSDERKGFSIALDVLRNWGRDFLLVLLGKVDSELVEALDGIEYRATGFLDDQSLLADWYSIGDIFLFTSKGDNLPNVILESMACGVPVVGFSVGGTSEMVDHKINGYMAAPGDLVGLREGLDSAFFDRELLARWSESARKTVEESFSQELFRARHLALYNSIASARGA